MLKNLTILILVLTAAINAAAQDRDAKRGADETAIRGQVEQLMKGWNAKNGGEFAKPFAEDADYVIINGRQIKGRDIIAKAHQGIFDTIYKNTTMSLTTESIRFLRADVAVVHVSGKLQFSGSEAPPPSRATMTLVITKSGNRWEIIAFQNTQLQEQNETKK